MNILEIINKKRESKVLTEEEIKFVIKNFTNKTIKDYQMSSFLMTITINGMNIDEISFLTKAMIESGKIIDLSSLKGIKLDKHSTGGIGDKTSLVLGPIIASLGGIVAKLSGRGLGHTGGTLDKLESIPGFKISLSDEEFIKILKINNISIISQSELIVPADKEMYALRDVTGTVNSIPLIASSIMSKKLATGSDCILLDIKCGSGAFMKNIDDARELAKVMILIGKKFNKDVKVEITDMQEPLGIMIGNKNEIIEVINFLDNKFQEPKFKELIYSSTTTMLKQAKIINDSQEAKKLIDDVLENKKALNKFFDFVKLQGGDLDKLKNPNFWNPKFQHKIVAKEDGFFDILDAASFGNICLKLGGGRLTKEDLIDFEAGIEMYFKQGNLIKKDDVLFTLSSSKMISQDIIDESYKIFKISSTKKENKVILETLS
ncbi:MAG: thymidine phosphorylase [Metamycoplasmataceae bacterium]